MKLLCYIIERVSVNVNIRIHYFFTCIVLCLCTTMVQLFIIETLAKLYMYNGRNATGNGGLIFQRDRNKLPH